MVGHYQEYTSGYFDVVVADECHRSIYGAWQVALTHFDALHIGLTATPAAYIERNTFDFYQCKDGQPDLTYPIQDAFSEGHLVPYRFAPVSLNLLLRVPMSTMSTTIRPSLSADGQTRTRTG